MAKPPNSPNMGSLPAYMCRMIPVPFTQCGPLLYVQRSRGFDQIRVIWANIVLRIYFGLNNHILGGVVVDILDHSLHINGHDCGAYLWAM